MAQVRKTSIPLIFTENLTENGEITIQKISGYGPPSFVQSVKLQILPEDIIQL